ncbi:hypothetical protein ACIQGZ_13060 [Streptomyces sp. NPDC092296]|uniref:hypothetical protein n=1 Tax=Streptomyces sp. NPDC092296 TaxID=3366012 RepID=UPI0038210E80
MTLEPRDNRQPPPYYGWEPATGPPGPEQPLGRGLPGRRTAVTVTAVVVLALGGAAYAATAGGPSGETPSAAPPGGATSPPAAPDQGGQGDRGGPGRWAAHGEATVRDPRTGQWTVRVWQRGTVERSGSTLTVKSADGTTWTWRTTSGTAVLSHGGGAIGQGQTVLLAGTRASDGTDTADRVLVGDLGSRDRHGRGGGSWYPGHHHGGRPWGDGDRGDRRPPDNPTSPGSYS